MPKVSTMPNPDLNTTPTDAGHVCSTDEFGALIERLTILERDHTPDGWPAVQMRDISALLSRLTSAPVAIMDTRDALGLCAPTEDDFPALYALQGHRVALVDLGPFEAPKKPPQPCRFPSCQFVGCPPQGCYEEPNASMSRDQRR